MSSARRHTIAVDKESRRHSSHRASHRSSHSSRDKPHHRSDSKSSHRPDGKSSHRSDGKSSRRPESYSGPPRSPNAKRMPPPPPPRVLRPLSIHIRKPAPGTGEGGSPLLSPHRRVSFKPSISKPEEILVLEGNGSAAIPILENRPRLPDITLRFLVPPNPNIPWNSMSELLAVSIRPLHRELAGQRTLLFGVPCPFSPDCNDHMDSFIRAVPLLKERGINKIVGVATEDIFVMNAWSEQYNLAGKPVQITLASDGNGELCRRLSMSIDMSDGIMGARKRFRRFVMLIERDLSISRYATEPDEGTGVSVTSAVQVIDWL
ncbi:thioredoxin-like protein [Syncephalis fuscata]|nr:thioredoxin-like protein [Syncephalis fuscata]